MLNFPAEEEHWSLRSRGDGLPVHGAEDSRGRNQEPDRGSI